MHVTYKSTGVSVLVSGLTTALALSILAISGFRGFSEFGIISAIAISGILLAMFVVLPSVLVILYNMKFLRKAAPESKKARIIPAGLAMLLVVIFAGVSVYSYFGLGFDYNLSNIDFDTNNQGDYQLVKDKQEQVYSMSMSPAAIYLAHGIGALDSLNKVFKEEKAKDSSMVGRDPEHQGFCPR